MARPDDRLLDTPQTAPEGTDGIIRSQQVRDPTALYVQRLESVRPYLRMLEGGVLQRGTHNGTHTNEEGLRAITS